MKGHDLGISPTKARLLLDYDAARQLGMSEKEWAYAYLKKELADPDSVWNRHQRAKQDLAKALDGMTAAFEKLARALRESERLEAEDRRSTDEAVAYMFRDLPEV